MRISDCSSDVCSSDLPTRSMVTVDGTLEGQPFQATLEPDGEGSHWLKVDKGLREAAGAEVGDTVALEISPVEKEPESKVPADLRKALTANPAAKATWRSEEHTSELQSLMRISYAVFCLKKKKK